MGYLVELTFSVALANRLLHGRDVTSRRLWRSLVNACVLWLRSIRSCMDLLFVCIANLLLSGSRGDVKDLVVINWRVYPSLSHIFSYVMFSTGLPDIVVVSNLG